MLDAQVEDTLSNLTPGAEVGVSPWLTVSQAMIDDFGHATLDPDPMHVDPGVGRGQQPVRRHDRLRVSDHLAAHASDAWLDGRARRA